MSTDRASGAGAPSGATGERMPRRGAARRTRRFRGTLLTTTVVLAALAVGFGAVGVAQGPKLARTDVDVASAVTDSGSRVIFSADRPLAEVDEDDVTIAPETPFSLTADGAQVAVRFDDVLDYDTEYTVTIDGVHAPGGDAASTFTRTFTTGSSPLYLLQRDTAGQDAILSASVADPSETAVVYRADRITQFEAVGDRLVVALLDEDDHSRLVSIDASGGDEREIALPGTGWVEQLHGSPRQGLVGFVFSEDGDPETTVQSGLFTVRVASEDEPRRVEWADASQVTQWQFVPTTTTVLVRTFEDELVMIDGAPGQASASPVVLGATRGIYGFTPDGTSAVVERVDGLVTLDLVDGTDAPLGLPDGIEGTAGRLAALSASAYARLFSVFDAAEGTLTQELVTVDGGATHVLSRSDEETALLDVCASPNGQYIALMTLGSGSRSDRYPVTEMPKGVAATVYETASGDVVGEVDGFDLSWCARSPGE